MVKYAVIFPVEDYGYVFDAHNAAAAILNADDIAKNVGKEEIEPNIYELKENAYQDINGIVKKNVFDEHGIKDHIKSIVS